MNGRTYWKQAQGEIPDGKTSSLSTRDVIKLSKREERQDGCNAKYSNIWEMMRSINLYMCQQKQVLLSSLQPLVD